MYKLLSTDLDRTFSLQKRIFKRNIKYLQHLKSKGVILVANTGRGVITGSSFWELNLFDYLIGNNGSIIYNLKTQKYYYNNFVAKEVVNKIINWANQANYSWIIESTEGVYFSPTKLLNKQSFIKNCNYPFFYQKNVTKSANKIIVFFKNEDRNKIINFTNQIASWKLEYWLKKDYIEIKQTNCDKGLGLLFLLKKLKIKTEDVVAIGDDVNDIPVFKNIQKSIIMGNGNVKARKYANYITNHEKMFGWIRGLKKYESS